MNKSPLYVPSLESQARTDLYSRWYNIPPSPSQLKKSKIQAGLAPSTSANTEQDMDRDSKPLDFNTFVPDHDPTLTVPAPMQIPDYGSYNISEANGPMVSQDEAFSRAMQAMYWAGYYSAVYHVSLPDQAL